MKKSSSTNPQKNSPLYNLVFVIVLILTALPFVLFALIQFAPPSIDTPATPLRLSEAWMCSAKLTASSCQMRTVSGSVRSYQIW